MEASQTRDYCAAKNAALARLAQILRPQKRRPQDDNFRLFSFDYSLTRRWCVLGMRMSSRYFATVRRVT
jgi:hypothetical protein